MLGLGLGLLTAVSAAIPDPPKASRQTDRPRDRQRDRQRDGQTDRHTDRRQTPTQTERETDRQPWRDSTTNREIDRETDRKTDIQRDRPSMILPPHVQTQHLRRPVQMHRKMHGKMHRKMHGKPMRNSSLKTVGSPCRALRSAGKLSWRLPDPFDALHAFLGLQYITALTRSTLGAPTV
jgi:hypothetical protein